MRQPVHVADNVDVQAGVDVDVEDRAAPEPRLQLPEVRPRRHPPSEREDRPRGGFGKESVEDTLGRIGQVLEQGQRVIGQLHPGAERAVLRVELQPQVGGRPAFDVQGEATIRGNGPVREECGDVGAGRGPLARRPVAVAERDALDRTGARVREAPHVETGCVAPVRVQADDHLRVVGPRGHECRRVPAPLGGHRVVGTGVGGEAERVSIGARDDVTRAGAAGEPCTRHRRRAGVERPDPEQEERVERSPPILSVRGTGEGVCGALDCVEELRFDRGVPVRDQLVEGPRLPPGDALGVGRQAIVEYLGKAVERMGRPPGSHRANAMQRWPSDSSRMFQVSRSSVPLASVQEEAACAASSKYFAARSGMSRPANSRMPIE